MIFFTIQPYRIVSCINPFVFSMHTVLSCANPILSCVIPIRFIAQTFYSILFIVSCILISKWIYFKVTSPFSRPYTKNYKTRNVKPIQHSIMILILIFFTCKSGKPEIFLFLIEPGIFHMIWFRDEMFSAVLFDLR